MLTTTKTTTTTLRTTTTIITMTTRQPVQGLAEERGVPPIPYSHLLLMCSSTRKDKREKVDQGTHDERHTQPVLTSTSSLFLSKLFSSPSPHKPALWRACRIRLKPHAAEMYVGRQGVRVRRYLHSGSHRLWYLLRIQPSHNSKVRETLNVRARKFLIVGC